MVEAVKTGLPLCWQFQHSPEKIRKERGIKKREETKERKYEMRSIQKEIEKEEKRKTPKRKKTRLVKLISNTAVSILVINEW